MLAAGLSLYGWAIVVSIPLAAPEVCDNGAANAFALFFGWMYIWFFVIVAVFLYLIVRLIVCGLRFLWQSSRSLIRDSESKDATDSFLFGVKMPIGEERS